MQNVNVATAPKDSTFRVRINSEGIPFLVMKKSKEAFKEQAVIRLLMELRKSEERAEREGYIEADDLARELGILD